MKAKLLIYGLLMACIPYVSQATDLSVYRGAGCSGVQNLAAFKSFLGRNPDRVVDFLQTNNWAGMQNEAGWAIQCWARSGLKVKLTLSVPMLPSDGVSTLAQGAQGAYNSQFTKLGTLLVQNGFADADLRLGWEFNGGWYAWAAKKDPTSWVAYWRQIVKTMRAVPGAKFTFDWNPTWGMQQILPSSVYPGDDVVDYIGMDMYNQDWGPGGTIVSSPQQRWKDYLNDNSGLNWLAEFAAQHNKPIVFPEWGTGTRPDGHGGGDDPYFVNQLVAWIKSHNLAYQSYFDVNVRGNSISCEIDNGQLPQSAAAYLTAYGK